MEILARLAHVLGYKNSRHLLGQIDANWLRNVSDVPGMCHVAKFKNGEKMPIPNSFLYRDRMYLVKTELGSVENPRCDICGKPLSIGTVWSLRPEDIRQAEDAWMFCQVCGTKISLSTDPKTTFTKMYLTAMYKQYDVLQAERAKKN